MQTIDISKEEANEILARPEGHFSISNRSEYNLLNYLDR